MIKSARAELKTGLDVEKDFKRKSRSPYKTEEMIRKMASNILPAWQ